MSGKHTRTDVCIVGAGALGLFTAWHLSRSGARVVVCDRDVGMPRPGLGAFWPSPSDPPTRAQTAHGAEMACYLIDLHGRGVALAAAPEFQAVLPSSRLRALRYGLESFERAELAQASSHEGFGLSATPGPVGLQEPSPLFVESGDALVLRDAQGWRERLAGALRGRGIEFLDENVFQLVETTSGVTLETDRGLTIEAEITVLATASRAGDLLAPMRDVFVPMTDAVLSWKRAVRKKTPSRALPVLPANLRTQAREALGLRGHNGHVAAVWDPSDDLFPLRLSGPRFLWPGAGVGVAQTGGLDAKLRARALDFHRAKTLPLIARMLGHATWEAFAEREGLTFHSARFGIDCLPCDELPVLGEFGKWGRLLGASGFLASGYSAQLQAARMLADLVESGTSTNLHPRLSPRRLREGR